jgi:hypothetical protein
MLQSNMLDDRNLTATSLPAIETDVFEETLSFDPTTGKFTFGPSTQDGLGIFRIPLATEQTIAINTGPNIKLVSPFLKKLTFNDSGSFGEPNPTLVPLSDRIEIPVTDLPTARGLLGFVLLVQFNDGTTTVHNIETPCFFITPEQPAPDLTLSLSYDQEGIFRLRADGRPLPGNVTLEKGIIILRLHDGSDPAPAIRVTLAAELVSAGIVFADPPVVLPPGFIIGVDITVQQNNSNTDITITKAFVSGTGFGVCFGLIVPLVGGQTCTVYSPDPIIIDKTIGSNPPD